MSTASRKPKRNAMIIVETTTTLTDEITSSRVGQTTLRSSPTQSFPNWTIFDIPVHLLPIVFLRKPEQTHQRQAYRESRPRGHPAKTGQAGLEPATFGFGDRRSTIRATDLGNRESLFQSAPGFPGKLPPGSLPPENYLTFVSLCSVCLRSNGQYLFNSSFPWVFFRFFLVV